MSHHVEAYTLGRLSIDGFSFERVAQSNLEWIFRKLDSGFQSLVGLLIPSSGFRIPKPRVPDSTSKKFLDSGIRILLHGAKVTETVFLGVIMDENLNWKSEISHVANKVSKCTAIIRKSSFYLSTKTLWTLHFSLVYPYFFYCNLVWTSTYRTNLIRLEILQKRVTRTIAKTPFDAHTHDPIFQNLNILKFHDIYLIQLGLFMYTYQNHTLPVKFHFISFPYKIKFIRIIQETLVNFVCLSVVLKSNNFRYFIKDLNFITP